MVGDVFNMRETQKGKYKYLRMKKQMSRDFLVMKDFSRGL